MTPETETKKKRSPLVLILIAAAVLVCLATACIVLLVITGPTLEATATVAAQAPEPTAEPPQPTETPGPTDTPSSPTDTPGPTNTLASTNTPEPTDTTEPTNTPEPTHTAEPTNTPEATNTPEPTHTPVPTSTPVPPTATPDQGLVPPGTYLVGADIQPGIYRGQAGYDIFESCYWARLKDLSGSLDSILANDNSIGQYYVEVRSGDKALETACGLVFLPSLPAPPAEFPQNIDPGTYLVGIDISPGTYRGQAGADIMDACYWARLRDVSGDMDSIITNDNATGQYYAEVLASDFALSTMCDLERIGD